MNDRITTHNLGFPRIGENRELKRALEAFWKGTLSLETLKKEGAHLRRIHWLLQQQAGIDLIPSNDFSFYDHMLDMSCLLGNIPERFKWNGETINLPLPFAVARGMAKSEEHDVCCGHGNTHASEMTKWFDTNYHYIVPEFHNHTTFSVASTKPFDEFIEALELGIKTKPVLIGPLTYLYLGKSQDDGNRLELLDQLIPVYVEILQKLAQLGAEWIQIDEPILALELESAWQACFAETYQKLREAIPATQLLLATYFGSLHGNLDLATQLPVNALHIDLTRSFNETDKILSIIPETLNLSLGIVDGRNIWKNDFEQSLRFIATAQSKLGSHRLLLAPSCSLLHCPVSLENEVDLDPEIKNWMAFAKEKLFEVANLSKLAVDSASLDILQDNQKAIHARKVSQRIHRAEVQARIATISAADSHRVSPYALRRPKQRRAFHLPLFPAATIGSFPQTKEIRQARARWKNGKLSPAAYEAFLKEQTANCIRFQEEVGLDVLVHGEFERNDMVEYFGEQLDGFVFTSNGWVQSYGSRCVKPPIIFGDVSRSHPMTVEWSTYAQSLTSHPMKGMLTGPITILQWSFVRDDQPRSETAKQISLAIRDEAVDLEAAGIRMIQIDEPALREGLPLHKSEWANYLDWATESFRLSASGVKDETQIHTHMCYCEFDDIIDSIAALDADVISIETSRSNMELLDTFATFKYPNEVGPGIWDIHSPRVPSVEEMADLLRKATKVLPVDNLWSNPDCGLKTRGWEETKVALRHLIAATKILRQEFEK